VENVVHLHEGFVDVIDRLFALSQHIVVHLSRSIAEGEGRGKRGGVGWGGGGVRRWGASGLQRGRQGVQAIGQFRGDAKEKGSRGNHRQWGAVKGQRGW
jgi:hypothetical protein